MTEWCLSLAPYADSTVYLRKATRGRLVVAKRWEKMRTASWWCAAL